MPCPPPTRLLVYTRQALVREGLRRVLPDHDVTGTGEDPAALIETARRMQPEVVVLDAASSGPDIESLAAALRQVVPDAKMVLLNGTTEGIALPLSVGQTCHMDYRMADTVLPKVLAERAVPKLTPRQAQILRRVAEGMASKQIAEELSLSIKTVEFHRARIMQKLGLHSVAKLARFAAGHGLVR